MMRDKLLERFLLQFGEPARFTKKVNAWHITSWFGIVIEGDAPKVGSYANGWLPEPFGDMALQRSQQRVTPKIKFSTATHTDTQKYIDTFLGYLLPE